MKAWQFNDSVDRPGLSQVDIEPPAPGPGELLIRVHAAGVTPSEFAWYPNTHLESGQPRLRAIPGHEFSGTVAAQGTDADSSFDIGHEVFGLNNWFAEGAMAEYCLARPSTLVAKPGRLSHVEAASVPIGALTAWQGLIDRAQLQAGERVLIHGGSGAVGVFAIQIASRSGAHVLTTASAHNRDFLIELGATQVIDYRTQRFEETSGQVDVVFDGVGGETRERSWQRLGPGGRLVTVAADAEYASDERTKAAFFIVEPNQDQLQAIAQQLDSGELRPVVERVIPFEQAGDAYQQSPTARRGCGKAVVVVI